jgi:hypothetical protein
MAIEAVGLQETTARFSPTEAAWRETYAGGSAEAEHAQFERLAKRIMRVQERVRRRAKAAGIARAFHAKPLLAVDHAILRFRDDLPADLTVGHARPGAAYPTIVRFSNASGAVQGDHARDLRGVALRVQAGDQGIHDLLLTNFPVSHARNAEQFVAFAEAMAGNRALGLARLAITQGPGETWRMLGNVRTASARPVPTIAAETFWSRGASLWGEANAVRLVLRPPGNVAAPAPGSWKDDPDRLRKDLLDRLGRGELRYELCVQRFVDERRTPIEDTAVEWREADAPAVPIAELVIPPLAAPEVAVAAAEAAIEGMAFSPWHTTAEFRPLGNLNRARKQVYAASAAHRQGLRFHTEPNLRNRIVSAPMRWLFGLIDQFVEWHRLPLHAGLLQLDFFRERLRAENLIDTEPVEAPPVPDRPAEPIPEAMRWQRSFDGTWNDLSAPRMGAVGTAFGRNLRPRHEPQTYDEPNPVEVADRLFTRKRFIPARSLNILAAAWIQFQVHDWVNHARHRPGVKDVRVPLPEGHAGWRNRPDGPLEREMRFADNIEKPGGGSERAPVLFGNEASHWWDGSEVYGSDRKTADSLRVGWKKRGRNDKLEAKLRLEGNGYLPQDVNGMEVTGFNESWWLGLSAMHTLFAREHNQLCDALQAEYPSWTQERIYQTARLIVAALIAKIHTVEWTPAILATEAIDIGLKGNWFGPQDWLTKLGLWLVDAHALKGIPETLPDHHTAPYCLTEDFVTVYRLHPLLPDDYRFVNHEDGSAKADHGFLEIQGALTDDRLRQLGLTDVLYSLGTAHPGAITLHNYPNALRSLTRTVDGVPETIDLAVLDLVRTRRRAVPRYNEFRAGLHKRRITRFEELCPDPEDARLMRELYRSVDRIDTVTGLLAEPAPHGFGFSDTAFRIFILMASRRLQSDRFLTVDYRPEIYSPLGLDWIARETMTSVILRNCPGLAGLVPRGASAFAPWRRASPV